VHGLGYRICDAPPFPHDPSATLPPTTAAEESA
jgi:hypothetical protein